jgi:hypothetical protein
MRSKQFTSKSKLEKLPIITWGVRGIRGGCVFPLILALMFLIGYFRSILVPYSYSNIGTNYELFNLMEESHSDSRSRLNLDFILAGFPKTGTTSLLHLLDVHKETSVIPKEICYLNRATDSAIDELAKLLNGLPTKSRSMLRGIKCPMSVWDAKGLSKLAEMNEEVKVIIGLRHPLSLFESFYNYRVTEMHDMKEIIEPPGPELLTGSNTWKGLSLELVRFEISLMQFGKVELTARELLMLGNNGRRLFPSTFKVFLYDIEQLDDKNKERSELFRSDLQHFLGIQNKIGNIPKSNMNHFRFGTSSAHPETISICDAKYANLRKEVIRNAKPSQNWIKQKFMNSNDVTVGGKEHFLDLLKTWEVDPCQGGTSK